MMSGDSGLSALRTLVPAAVKAQSAAMEGIAQLYLDSIFVRYSRTKSLADSTRAGLNDLGMAQEERRLWVKYLD